MASIPDLSITSITGMNDTDPSSELGATECQLALNVEFFFSSLCERRAGMDAIDISSLTLTGQTAAVHINEWFPTNDVHSPELFAIFAAPASASVNPVAAVRDGSVSGQPVWTSVTIPSGSKILTAIPGIYNIRAQSLNGLLFLAYDSGNPRLHVWDQTNWRVTGLAQPGAPTATAVGVGALISTRYYRVRVQQKSGSKVIRQSEPSTSVSVNGAGSDHIHIVQGTVPGEGETHWVVEGSADNSTFYVLATVVIATTTYDDSTVDPLTFSSNPQSAAIGAYVLQPSFRYVANDGDRLLGAGNWNDPSLDSTVYWSPVSSDPGVGNSERQPVTATGGAAITTSIALDNYAGGGITGISSAINGNWYAFKYGRIYMMTRTGDATLAYDVLTLSTSRGAIKGSIIEGADESGAACVYFLDPTYGPSRIGPGGLVTLEGLRTTWKRVNLNAQHVVATGCFYKYKRQVHWWVAADGADEPTLKLIAQTDNMVWEGQSAVKGGWSLADGTIAKALRVATYTEWVIESDNSISLSERPFIATNGPLIARTDVNTTDNGTAYVAKLITRPYVQTGILNWWGVMVGSLLASANLGQSVKVQLIRDWGLETIGPLTVSLSPAVSETYVISILDNLALSHAHAIQVQLSDT